MPSAAEYVADIRKLGWSGLQKLWTLIGARFVLGIAVGTASFVAPMYIGELVPPKIRGGLVRFIQLWKNYNRSLSELSRLGDRELADIGIARSDIPRVAWENAQHV